MPPQGEMRPQLLDLPEDLPYNSTIISKHLSINSPRVSLTDNRQASCKGMGES